MAMAMGAPSERAAVLAWAREEPLPVAEKDETYQVFLQTDPYLFYEPPAPPSAPGRGLPYG